MAAEVKWKDRVDRSEIRKAEEKLGRVDAARKLLIVKDEASLERRPESLEVIGPESLGKLLRP